MKILADMGVSMVVVEWLRSQGHNVLHLTEQGLQRLPNGQIFEKARAEERTVLTFDLDFGEISAWAQADQRVGVVIFRLHNARSEHVIDRLRKVLPENLEALADGAVLTIEETRYRIRRFAN
jgi:predicted nuclease of predicted toxin-antitoxin system